MSEVAARIIAKQNALLKSVLGARIYDLARETPLSPAPKISAMIKNTVHLKREDMQEVFSFKIRGAYHKMTRLSPARLRRGVVAASAGNHAQGVAAAAARLRCRAAIVMPRYAQKIKVAAVRARGAKVVLHGDSFDDADIFARRLAAEERATFIPPFDDADIIAGNGTIAAEILRQHPAPLHAIFCAVGGGGLVAGIAGYVKALRPEVRVFGVESEESACMIASLRAGRPTRLSHVGAFADAVAVKKPGRLPFEFVRALVDEVFAVGNDEICAAVKDLYEDTRVIFEPGGALALAGAKHYAAKRRLRGKNIIVLAGGANMNFDRLRFVSERAEIGEQREALFAVTIPERPGSFRRFCALLGGRDITAFNYRLDDRDSAHIFVGAEIRGAAERRDVLRDLRAAGLPAIDLTDDEMAKLHLRHLAGGRARAENEELYRFEFPERPGALMNFLNLLDRSRRHWNISLFHYRNNGGDAGRVLVGVQVPPAERKLFARALRELDYPHCRETDNPASRLFLQRDSGD
ncbi:MAG: threonine ammonia-lyase, biosynthetic [Gammaproteobacteria bacterium]